MLLNLFENLGEQILPDTFIKLIGTLRRREPGFNPTQALMANRAQAAKLKHSFEQSSYLMYCRAWALALVPNIVELMDNPQMGIALLGEDAKKLERVIAKVGRGNIERVIQGRRAATLTNPPTAHSLFMHFRGNAEGAPGMPIPQLHAMRINPTDWFPDVLERLTAIEKEFKPVEKVELNGINKFASMRDVPANYILATENTTADAEVLHEYDMGNMKYVWLNLGKKNDPAEATAMGHCANTNSSGAVLYSFRSLTQFYIEDIREFLMFQRPHLTAAVNPKTKVCYELRGGGNTKPKPEYHSYIIDLVLQGDVTKFLYSSYENAHQFKIQHLSEEDKARISHVIDLDQALESNSPTYILFNGNGAVPEQQWRDAVREIVQHLQYSLLGGAEIEQEANSVTRYTAKARYTWMDILEHAIPRYLRGRAPKLEKALMRYLKKTPDVLAGHSYNHENPALKAVEPRALEILKKHSDDPRVQSFLPLLEGQKWLLETTVESFYEKNFKSSRVKLASWLNNLLREVRLGDQTYGYYFSGDQSDLSNNPEISIDLEDQWRTVNDGRDDEEEQEAYESLYWMGDGIEAYDVDNLSYDNMYDSDGKAPKFLAEVLPKIGTDDGIEAGFQPYFEGDGPHDEWLNHVHEMATRRTSRSND